MNKHKGLWLCTLLLCALMFLVGCSGNKDSATDAGEEGADAEEVASDSSEESKPKADPAIKFIGTWRLAGMSMGDLTVVGNLAAFMGTEERLSIVVDVDGTGSIALGEEPDKLEWELANDQTIVFARSTEGDGKDDAAEGNPFAGTDTIVASYREGSTLEIPLEGDGQSGSMVLTKNGVLPNVAELSTDDATAVASVEQVTGEWTLTGMSMEGITFYGNAEALDGMTGGADDQKLIIAADGSVTALGDTGTLTVGEDGSALTYAGYEVPLYQLGDDLVLDLGAFVETGLLMRYSK